MQYSEKYNNMILHILHCTEMASMILAFLWNRWRAAMLAQVWLDALVPSLMLFLRMSELNK